ncbi:MAG: ADP-forming succinate--CoA ligase subunit beta [Rickettsiales bacterium]|nr:ADP-forming succinate--CoA ligase subunit beta [Pseudomonadota bacterium]MDA0967089.1 ADP-forming succinate--CoA ligase subunit beta [Pseudomonadota bacterium]MDG4542425.1 ADP-forming succinate--CoA ligase subunit beta [Rickettsiales bacterium]MDG4544929.1 ADP-forming succinate--CoA ligase subunit beta [Rickettsiales bacterium]MDG4547052.1 ADP-forming succinate--CoA ligase subunit beta [Rickettsiales bacterium]
MDIHEYQGKRILAGFGVPVPEGYPAHSAKEAEEAAKELPGPVYVVKSQIHAGGRGKGKFKETPNAAGGVRVVKSVEEVRKNAEEMLGNTLITIQTGEEGKQVNRLYIEDGSDIKKEYYLSLLVDRETSKVAFVASTEGGMDIEEVAHNTPEKIITLSVDPASGISGFHARKLGFALGFSGDQLKQFSKIVFALYEAFLQTDASQIEINPLVLTGSGQIVVLDAKCGFDDNALFRHPDIEDLRDESEENPQEKKAKDHELSYVKMDGNIGCMVNGAGLAMATMDIIKLKGGEPANFLDVGGGATKERVTEAFKIILSDDNVQGILVNIFGGIMRCDVIAEGVIAAAKEVALSVPLVVRLEGTNVALGKEILNKSGLDIIPANDLEDAATKVVAAVKNKAAA